MNSTNFICQTLFYHQISMAMPKANNDQFSAKSTKFSRQEFIQPNSHKSADLTKIAQISCISRLQGPIPAPSQTNNLQLIEFWPTPAITHS